MASWLLVQKSHLNAHVECAGGATLRPQGQHVHVHIALLCLEWMVSLGQAALHLLLPELWLPAAW